MYILAVGEQVADQLLRRIRDNDREFVAELRRIIERIAMKWNWTDSDSLEDIAQDCFIKVVESLSSGRFEGRSSFSTYVYTITRRTCIDYYRAARAVELDDIEQVPLPDPACSQEEQMLAAERRKTAYLVLMALPRECRRLWRMIFFGNRNYRQAADTLGVSEGSVKRKMWQCRQWAREKIEFYEK